MLGKCPTCGRSAPKSNAQRNEFHRLCTEIGNYLGESPAHVKAAVKIEHLGIEEFQINGVWYRDVRHSELCEKDEYSALIEAAYRWAAERGIHLAEAA